MFNKAPTTRYLSMVGSNEPLLPGADVIGFGYNVNGEFARTESTLGQSLFVLPGGDDRTIEIDGRVYRYNQEMNVSMLYRSDLRQVQGNTIELYREELGQSVGVAGDYKLFSASLKVAYKSTSLSQEETTYTTVREVHRLWQINLPGPTRLQKYLKAEVRELLENNQVSPHEVFDSLGAYYISEAVVGGRIDYNAATKSLRTNSSYDVSVIALASYQALVGEIKADNASKLGKDIENFRSVSAFTLQTVGGKPGLGDRIFYDDDKHSAFAEWSASLLSYAVLMDFTDDSLAPIWLLVADQKRRNVLAQAFPEWLQNKIKPVPKQQQVLTINRQPPMICVGNDVGSGARRDLSVWAPSTDEVNKYGGQFAQPNHASGVDGRSVLLRDLYELGYLKAPVSFTLVWTDTGSDKSRDYACWRAVPPAGYRALGDLMVLASDGYSVPDSMKKNLICVHESLCRDLEESDFRNNGEVWNDSGTGARQDLSLWHITPPDESRAVKAGTFIGVNHRGAINHDDIDRFRGVLGVLLSNYTTS